MLKFLFILLFSLQTYAQIQETPDLQSCLTAAEQATAAINPADVVYVFDIDNTALKLKHNFGSVQWYHWQQKLIQEHIEADRVSETMDGLLAIQSSIYQMSAAETPEPTTALQVTKLQNQGHPVLFHTSRNLDNRESTIRELKLNGLLPLTKTLGPAQGFAGDFTYTEAPATQRPVSFQNGVYMSAGQDKGIWLGLLFSKTQYHPKHVVFIDDEAKNLINVERAMKDLLPLTLCRYGKVDEAVAAFDSSDKAAEKQLWNQLKDLSSKLK